MEHDLVEPGTEAPAYGDPRAVSVQWTVPLELDGVRADQALVAKVRRMSRTRAQRFIEQGDFRIDADAVKPSTRVRGGQVAELWRLPPDEELDAGVSIPVLFEDEHLLVLNKPGDLAVHPTAKYLRQTVTHWLRRNAGTDRRPNPCHRLDRETSGVLICAKDRSTESAVKTAFAGGRVDKRYLAVVRGAVVDRLEIDAPLSLQGHRGLVRIRMIPDPAGLPSSTSVFPIAVDETAGRSLVACVPHTGRQHQIRAHLAAAGFPVAGDKLYAMGDEFFDRFTSHGVPDDAEALGLESARHALHATRATVRLGGEVQSFDAPLPADLRALIAGVDALDERIARCLQALSDEPEETDGYR